MPDKSYTIAGLSIYIEGDETPVRQEIEGMFKLSASSRKNTDIAFIIHEVSDLKEIESYSPDWVISALKEPDQSENIIMIYPESLQSDDFGILWSESHLNCCIYYIQSENQITLIVIKKSAQGKIPSSVPSMIAPLLSELFAQQDKILLHTASLLLPGKTGIFVSADARGGKTTTALSLIRQGAKLAGDDLAVVSFSESGKPYFQGIPETINIREQTITFFAELQKVCSLVTKLENGNYPVSPVEIYPDCLTYEKCSLDCIYFVKITSGKPAVKELGFIEAYQKLLKSRILIKNQKFPAHLSKFLFQAVDNIRIFELGTGDDPEFLGKWIINHAASQ